MSLTRELIISTLRQQLEPLPAVLAMWLEGADAAGAVDAFSDIDVCCSVEAGALDAVAASAQAALESLGPLDLIESSTRQSDFRYSVFHLQETSAYLLIDFNLYVGRGSQFNAGDAIEKPLILFDRAGVIGFVPPDAAQNRRDLARRLKTLTEITAQVARIEKYIRRGNFLEAFGYYHKWLLLPLIEALRMRYTPLHSDYYIVHISRHLPAPVLRRLEDLFQIASLADLDGKSRAALAFFAETAAFLEEGEERGPVDFIVLT